EAGPTAEIGARLTVAGLAPEAGLRAIAVATAGNVRVGRLARVLLEPASAESPLPIAVFESGSTGAAAGTKDTDPWHDTAHAVVLTADAFNAKAGSATPPSETGTPVGVAAMLRGRLAALTPGLGRDRVAVGLSDRFGQAADLAGAIEEARLAMRLAMRRSGQLELAEHDELASHLVLLAHVPDELRRGYRERLLGPLRTYDARHHSQLEETLDRFLACSASWSRCAQEMHIHVNTLRYRIEKINQLTGRDLARLDHQVDFYLALRAR
ncbi:MAG TPA: helix-turn-helix domain-containing protein, partial [Actinocrinis sp.]|uniref:PucR family transcriptional regulator n=1 Tax=Actinocrinis sp. TaxID=1920516 RepID=UPI002DDCFDD3